ncbi:MAG TPA: hypothetical protein VKC55_00080 [Actinomycetota bacterium]|nr:hypothetical protein [Actinomycetota bacterium]
MHVVTRMAVMTGVPFMAGVPRVGVLPIVTGVPRVFVVSAVIGVFGASSLGRILGVVLVPRVVVRHRSSSTRHSYQPTGIPRPATRPARSGTFGTPSPNFRRRLAPR